MIFELTCGRKFSGEQ